MESLWLKNQNMESNQISKDEECDVCVIGAGICGLSTAYYLAKSGLKVIVLDKDGIGEKTSGHTTAKITLQHGLIYDYLINSLGKNKAYQYFEANRQAISNIEKIIETEKIDCDYENQSNYIYTTNKAESEKIKKEIEAINKLANDGNYAEYVTECDFPIKIECGIKTMSQAQFNPAKYMTGLQKSIEYSTGKVYTHSLVTDVKRDKDAYTTFANDYKVNSKYVVLASHYPFINFPGFYFTKMYQVTSYAIAIKPHCNLFEGMYITANEPTLSFRTALDNGERLIIIAGGNHKTGFSPESQNIFGYKYIENCVKEIYPNCEIVYKWNTRDCITLDKIPYIGEFSDLMPNVFVATGFNKWGMTSSNVAANIIADKITNKDNNYSEVFDSKRLKPIKNIEELKNMTDQVVKSFITNRIKIPKEDLDTVKDGNGGIIKINGENVGVYKTKEGKISAVNPTCTHLGCLLTWNNVDKTWDCPCHGSRFDYKGKNIYDPAFKDLSSIYIEE